MLTILASFAQTEVEAMSQNIKWSIQKKFREGRLNGCVPFMGYRWDDDLKKLVIVPEEAETVRRIFYMYRDGYSLQNIVDALHDDGIKPIRGKRKGFADGKVSFAYSNFLGLDYDWENEKLVINEEQAKVVRLIAFAEGGEGG